MNSVFCFYGVRGKPPINYPRVHTKKHGRLDVICTDTLFFLIHDFFKTLNKLLIAFSIFYSNSYKTIIQKLKIFTPSY